MGERRVQGYRYGAGAFENRGVRRRSEPPHPFSEGASGVARSQEIEGMRPGSIARSFGGYVGICDLFSFGSEKRAVLSIDLGRLAYRDDDFVYAGNSVSVVELLRNALASRRNVLDEKRRDAAMGAGCK